MADLSEQLSAILGDPAAQENIRNMLSSLMGGEAPPGENSSPPPDFSAIFGAKPAGEQNPAEAFAGVDMDMIFKIQKIFSAMNRENSGIDLIRALRPHLRNPEKADEAMNILRLLSVLPALGESGIFGGDKN